MAGERSTGREHERFNSTSVPALAEAVRSGLWSGPRSWVAKLLQGAGKGAKRYGAALGRCQVANRDGKKWLGDSGGPWGGKEVSLEWLLMK